ncbi:MAG: hypothetical protein ACOYY2_10350 [Actinomycetota bacterium]
MLPGAGTANRVWPAPAGAGVAERDYADCGVRRLWCALHYALADRSEEGLPAARAPALVVRGGRDLIAPQSWAAGP